MRGVMSWREGKTAARSHLARSFLAGILVSFCLWGGIRNAEAHEKHKHPAATPPPGAQGEQQSKATTPALRLDENNQREYFTDLPLLTQDGKEVHFYTDMLKGKVVLISFICTNCTEVCPILMPILVRIQELLGDRSGRDVSLISISVDPEDDTPEELKEYGKKYGAKPGWTFLTGKKENIDWVVYKLGQYAEDFEDHSMLFLVGDVKNARWAKMRGDMPPETIAARLLEFLAKR
ncbi:MAG: SCO family protein [Deltaproteobacteria bacterium]|nr:MAG: SCO family protein [Deltaproteobacteria bacterium]